MPKHTSILTETILLLSPPGPSFLLGLVDFLCSCGFSFPHPRGRCSALGELITYGDFYAFIMMPVLTGSKLSADVSLDPRVRIREGRRCDRKADARRAVPSTFLSSVLNLCSDVYL